MSGAVHPVLCIPRGRYTAEVDGLLPRTGCGHVRVTLLLCNGERASLVGGPRQVVRYGSESVIADSGLGV
jgi:hypothetical protein